MSMFFRSKAPSPAPTSEPSPAAANSSARPATSAQALSTTKPTSSSTTFTTVKHPSSEDLHAEDHHAVINIKRSDGVTKDLANVFANKSAQVSVQQALKAVNEKIADAAAAMNHKRASMHLNKPIVLKRSDGEQDCVIKLASRKSDTSILGSVVTGKKQEARHSFSAPLGSPKNVRIVHFSDTFGLLTTPLKTQFLPPGDILVHSGNFTAAGEDKEYAQFNEWLGAVSTTYHYRIICVGNKDVRKLGMNWDAIRARLTNATHVLLHSSAKVLGITFYGVPWNNFYSRKSQLRSGISPKSTAELNNRYNEIPTGINVLVTHAPAYNRLDLVYVGNGIPDERWGSRDLAEELRRVRPGCHLVGHVREGRGYLESFGHNALTVNACMADRQGKKIISAPMVVSARQVHSALVEDCEGMWEFEIDSLWV